MDYKLKLMADYECFPLWGVFEDCQGNIDPEELPISTDLKKRLAFWQSVYDSTLNQKDPGAGSGFASEHDELTFERMGFELWKALSMQLPETTAVSYFSERTHTEYFSEKEYTD